MPNLTTCHPTCHSGSEVPKISSSGFSKSVVVSCFTFQIVTHFELNFVEGVRTGPGSFSVYDIQLLQATCWKESPSPAKLLLHLCQNSAGVFVFMFVISSRSCSKY